MSINFQTQTPNTKLNNNNCYTKAKDLYTQFTNGERPRYYHNIDEDPNMIELNALSDKYRQSQTIDNKKQLLQHESKMLYEELEHPELTLARNYSELSDLIDKNKTPTDINNILTSFNLEGIQRIERMGKPFEPIDTPEKLKKIDATKEKVNKNASFGAEIQAQINKVKFIINKGLLSDISDNKAHRKLIDSLNKNSNQETSLKDLLQNANKNEFSQTTNIVNSILHNEKAAPEIKRLAVWGAGKFRSEEGFNTIKSIALNTNERDIRLREFAIHSTALYLKEQPDEVKSIMNTIENDGSIFEPLGQILNDKVNGKYHGQKDREFKYHRISEQEEFTIKYYRDKILNFDAPLNIHKRNQIDRDIILHKDRLLDFTKYKQGCTYTNDTTTKYLPHKVGERNFDSYGFSYKSGYYNDSIIGINNPTKGSIINTGVIGGKFDYGTTAHELGHSVNRLFNDKDFDILNKLYSKANKENKHMDSYSSSNVFEYYAQGCEAMASIYKPHKHLINSDTAQYSNTIYKLMTKDPELYNFVKRTVKEARR